MQLYISYHVITWNMLMHCHGRKLQPTSVRLVFLPNSNSAHTHPLLSWLFAVFRGGTKKKKESYYRQIRNSVLLFFFLWQIYFYKNRLLFFFFFIIAFQFTRISSSNLVFILFLILSVTFIKLALYHILYDISNYK